MTFHKISAILSLDTQNIGPLILQAIKMFNLVMIPHNGSYLQYLILYNQSDEILFLPCSSWNSTQMFLWCLSVVSLRSLTCLGRAGFTSSTLLVFILVFISCLCWRTALSLGPSQVVSLLGFRMTGISLTPCSGSGSTASPACRGDTM